MRIAGGKTRHAQNTQRIFGKCGGNMAQQTMVQIALTAVGIDNVAIIILCQRIDGQVAAQQILLKRHIRRGIAGKSGVTKTGFSFGAGKRVLFVALWMEKHGKIAAYLLVTRVKHLCWRGANHHPIFVFDRQAQQGIANCTTDQITLHAA